MRKILTLFFSIHSLVVFANNVSKCRTSDRTQPLITLLGRLSRSENQNFSVIDRHGQIEIRDSSGVSLPGFPLPKQGILGISHFNRAIGLSSYSGDGKFFGLLIQGTRYDSQKQESNEALFLILFDTANSPFQLTKDSKLLGIALAKTVPFAAGLRGADPYRTFEPVGVVTRMQGFNVETLKFRDSRPQQFVVNMSVASSVDDLKKIDPPYSAWTDELGSPFARTQIRFLKFSLPQP